MMILTLLSLAHATTWTVDPSGSGDAKTISSGLRLLSDGDTLSVLAGTYAEQNISITASNILIRGEGWESTILDGTETVNSADNTGLQIWGENVVFDGVSFQNYIGLTLQSAVYVTGSVSFQGCAFVNNSTAVHAAWHGSSTISILDTVFAENQTAINIPDSLDTLRIENALFVDNHEGVELPDYEDGSSFNLIEVLNSTFVGGRSAIVVEAVGTTTIAGDSEVVIVNNLFSGMDYRWALGLRNYDGGMTAEIRNNVYSTGTIEYEADDGSTYTLANNLEGEPEFVVWSDDDDWTNDDLHLTAGSPGIDAGVEGYGTSATDLDGLDRVVDGDGDGLALPDAGAYEYCPPDLCPEADTGATDDTGGTGETDTASDSADSATDDTDSPSDTGSIHHKDRSLFGCSTAQGPASGLALAVFALLGLRRRRT